MKVTEIISEKINRFPVGYVFTYEDFDIAVDKIDALTKAFSRMLQEGKIRKLSPGRFYKPRMTEFGELKPDTFQVVKDLLEQNGKITGYLTGYATYNQLGLTSQVSGIIQIGINEPKKSITRGMYKIRFIKQPNKITKENIPILRLLDAISNIKEIPDTTVEQSCSHAGESETSLMMHLTPACVTCPAGAEEGRAQGRLQHLASARLSTGIDWYANYPHHFSGNGTPGSAEKGARFFDILVDNLATQIRAAKADQTVAALFREFHERSAAPAEAHSIPSVLPVTNSIWNGFPKQSFALQGTPAYVVRPQTAAPGNPWIWRTAWPDYHAEVDLELLRAGYHLGYVEVVDLLGADKALDIMDLFYAQVRSQWRLAEKPAVEPNSRGGLHAYRYAVRHPERVACILGDVPVMDFKSWPLQHPGSKDNWPQVIAAYGFRDDAEALAYKGNPIDQLEPIAKAKIPIRHVICLSDRVVPPEENTLEAKRRLQRMGWDIEVVAVPESQECEGHHFPYPEVGGSFQFVITHAGGCAQP